MYIQGVSEIGRHCTYVVYGPKHRENFTQTSVLGQVFLRTSKHKKIIHISDFKSNGPRMTGFVIVTSKNTQLECQPFTTHARSVGLVPLNMMLPFLWSDIKNGQNAKTKCPRTHVCRKFLLYFGPQNTHLKLNFSISRLLKHFNLPWNKSHLALFIQFS